MKVTAANYEQLRLWFAVVCEVWCDGLQIRSESHPVKVLDAMAKRWPAKARTGLGMAIGDIMEDSEGWPAEKVAALDRRLRDQGLPPFSTMRLEFGERITGVLRRGRIRNEAEYYLVRNAAEMTEMPEHELWALIAEYEQGFPSGPA